MAEKYITATEYANYYRLTVERVWFLLRKGRIPGAKRFGTGKWLLQRRFRPLGNSEMKRTLRQAVRRLAGIKGSLGKESEGAGDIISEIDLPPIPFELQRPILPDE